MAGLRVHVVMPQELVERVDAARGDGSRGDFIRRAVVRVLAEGEVADRYGLEPPAAEQPERVPPVAMPGPVSPPAVEQSRRGPDVAAFRRATQR